MRVAIAGAGPAGAAAAILLARAGVETWLLDKASWPRAKTCGDGLTPSSVLAYRELGIELTLAPSIATTAMVSPSGIVARGHWPTTYPNGTIRPRVESDGLLLEAAIAAGARFEPGTSVSGWRRGLVSLATRDGATIAADALLVADGATGALAGRLGFPPHRSRLVAIRGYTNARTSMPPEYYVHYDAELVPGYGWVFPVTPQRANVGIAVTEDVARRYGGDLRGLMRAWLERDRVAQTFVSPHADFEDVHGGIIPSGRAKRYADGALLIGDAAGVADPLSAEGVSQAIATGVAAARALIAHRGDVDAAGRAYESGLHDFDRNEREARRMMRWMRIAAEPLVAIAAARPPVADALIETGYFLKTDGSWFGKSMAAAFAFR